MEEGYVYSPFNEVIGQFVEFLEPILSTVAEIGEKRKIKKSASSFLDLVINESKNKNVVKIITDDIIKNMPEGIWNVETIALVENKLKIIFDNDFVSQLKNNPQFKFEDSSKKSYFLKSILLPMLNMQQSGIKLLRNQVSIASVNEKDRFNIRVGGEIIDTLDLINEKTKKFSLNIQNTEDITTDDFSKSVKMFWTSFMLLFLRIVDIVLSYNNRTDVIKKLNYLSIERVRIGSYY